MSYAGNVHTRPILDLANSAARFVMKSRRDSAVTLDKSGKVNVVAPDAAPDADLVGTYRYTGLLDTSRSIAVDLMEAALERGLHKEAA